MDTAGYLNDLEKWQACSHPNLTNRKPEHIFDSTFVERYHCLHRDIWLRICRVHGTLYTLYQLRDFPFDYLYAPHEMEFWRLLIENFIDMACVIMHGLVNDTGRDVLNILSFKNEISKGPWLDETMRELFMRTLQERKFDANVSSIAKRVGEIRNHRIAHRLFDRQSGQMKDELAGVSLDELQQLFEATHHMFGALSFGSSYATLVGDLIPGTVGGKPRKSSVDEVLDAVLRDSDFVNEPERRKEWW